MGKELIPGQMDKVTLENGKMARLTAMEFFVIVMERDMQATMKMIKDTDMELVLMPMEKYLPEDGRMIVNKEKEL